MSTIFINSAADLAQIGVDPGYPLSGNYQQTANIVLDGDWGDWTTFCIGRLGDRFSGTYDGGEYTISGLYILDKSSWPIYGLFGRAAIGAKFMNIHLLDVQIDVYDQVGALLGEGEGVEISNCSSSGTITGRNNMGGLVGYLSGKSDLSNCVSQATIVGESGAQNIGGMVGFMDLGGSTAIDCIAGGTIEVLSASYVGGFVGMAERDVGFGNCEAHCNIRQDGWNNSVGGFAGELYTALNCKALGDITIAPEDASAWYVGGFVGKARSWKPIQGYSYGAIHGCHAYGDVTGRWSVGGFAGGAVSAGWPYREVPLFFRCSALGDTTSIALGEGEWSYVGGFIGEAGGGDIDDCFVRGAVTAHPASNIVGGFAGENNIIISRCYSAGPIVGGTSGSGVGGFVGENVTPEKWGFAEIHDCFYDSDLAPGPYPAEVGVTGKTTEEMQDISTFNSAGWDISAL